MEQAEPEGRFGDIALIALGSNVAAEGLTLQETIENAILRLKDLLGGKISQSRLFRTPAFPTGSGPDFVNAAIRGETRHSAEALLAAMHRIEANFGRVRTRRWMARSLDLDLLALGDAVYPDSATQTRWRDLPSADQQRLAPETLILPHPRLQDRAFVLVPLAEIAPDWRHPLLGLTVAEMLARLPLSDRHAIQAINPAQ